MTPTTATPCPCGSHVSYQTCCGRWHGGPLHLQAPDAEHLMRSRYCAFVVGLDTYVLATWHASTRPAALELQNDATRWLGLEVRRHWLTGDSSAEVEFIARSKNGGRATRQHEISRFVRERNVWYYVDGAPGGTLAG